MSIAQVGKGGCINELLGLTLPSPAWVMRDSRDVRGFPDVQYQQEIQTWASFFPLGFLQVTFQTIAPDSKSQNHSHRMAEVGWDLWGLFGPNPLLMQGQSHQRGDLKCPCQPASLLLRFFDSLVVLLKLRRLFLRAVCPGPVLANRTPLMDATLCVTKCDPDMGNCCRDGSCWDLGSNDTASTA